MKLEFVIYKEARTPKPIWVVESRIANDDTTDRSEHTSRLKAFNNLWHRSPGCEMFYVIIPDKPQSPLHP